MPYYEVLCLASGRLARKELSDVLRKACRAFMDNGGVVTRLTAMGADGNGPRKLAYPIRLNQVTYNDAFFVNVCAFSSPATVEEVNRQLRIDERILRHLAIRRPIEDSMQPSPDVDTAAPPNTGVDPSDPEYALRKFMEEYERDFPTGITFASGDEETDSGANAEPKSADDAVGEVVARLKASSRPTKDAGAPGLEWLSKMDKRDPS